MKLIDNDLIPNVINFFTIPLRILLSADSLIFKLANAKNLHIDGTYKITTCNFPIVVVGITDLKKKNLIADGIVENETAETY